MTEDFSQGPWRRGMAQYRLHAERTAQRRIRYAPKRFFRNKGEIEAFLVERKLREFVTSIPSLKE